MVHSSVTKPFIVHLQGHLAGPTSVEVRGPQHLEGSLVAQTPPLPAPDLPQALLSLS